MNNNKNIILLYLALFMTLVVSISIYIYANRPEAEVANIEEVKHLLIDASEKLNNGLQKTDTTTLL